MSVVTHRWALLMATRHGNATAGGMSAEVRQREMRQLLARALPPYNFLVEPASTSVLAATERALVGIQAREAGCPVILIPADHCAAVETSWVISAGEALRLAATHQDTVYLLHDKPHEPLPFDAVSDMCSSSVDTTLGHPR